MFVPSFYVVFGWLGELGQSKPKDVDAEANDAGSVSVVEAEPEIAEAKTLGATNDNAIIKFPV